MKFVTYHIRTAVVKDKALSLLERRLGLGSTLCGADTTPLDLGFGMDGDEWTEHDKGITHVCCRDCKAARDRTRAHYKRMAGK